MQGKTGVDQVVALGNQYFTVADEMNGFPWEEALIRAETGMDLSVLKHTESKAKYAGHYGIMANRNGSVKSYSIPESIKSHIFKEIEMIKPGENINNHLNERIAYIYYKYDNYDEALNDVLHMNDNIKIEFKD